MQIARRASCLPRRNALCEKADEHAGERISRSSRSHPWVPCGANHEQTIGPCDHCPGTLQHDKNSAFACEAPGRAEAIGVDALWRGVAFQTRHLTGMRSENGRSL